MNRRSLLTNGLKAAGAIALAASVRPFSFASRRSDWTQVATAEQSATIRRMINEQGKWWRQTRDRENGQNPALIYFGDGNPAFEVSRNSLGWQIKYRELTQPEAKEFDNYIDSLSRYIPTKIGDRLGRGSNYKLRAWIKNGRKPNWNMSVDRVM